MRPETRTGRAAFAAVVLLGGAVRAGELDEATARVVAPPKDGTFYGSDLEFSADGRLLVRQAELWDARAWKKLRDVDAGLGPLNEVFFAALSPDGSRVALGGGHLYHGAVAVAEAESGRVLWTKEDVDSTCFVEVAFSPDGKTVAAAGGDRLSVWDAETGAARWASDEGGDAAARRRAEGVWRSLTAVAVSPDGRTIVTAGSVDRHVDSETRRSGQAIWWDVATGRPLRTVDLGPGGGWPAVAFARDGRLVATASSEFRPATEDAPASAAAEVRLWDAATGEAVRTVAVPGSAVQTLAFSADGATLYGGGFGVADGRETGGELRTWDVRTGEPGRAVPAHAARVSTAVVSPDGRSLVTTGADRALKVWAVAE